MKKNYLFAMLAAAAVLVACNRPDPDPDPEPGPGPDPVPEYHADFTTITLSPSSESTAMMAFAGSPDGKYVAGANFISGNPATWNIEDNTVVDMANVAGDAFFVTAKGTIVGQGRDASDEEAYNQYAFIGKGASGKFLYYDSSEVETEWGDTAPVEDGSAAYSISEDEQLIAGFYTSGWTGMPCIWKAPFTGAADRIALPVPSSDELGFNVEGGEVRWMSSDASVLCGFVMDDTSSWPLVIWNRQADGSYKADPICAAYFHPYEWEPASPVTAPYMMFHPTCISANGEWVGLQVQEYSEEFDVPMHAARMNLKTKELEVFEGANFEPGSISNDGTVVGSTPQSFWDPQPIFSYVWKAGEKDAIDVTTMVGQDAFEGFAETKMVYIAPDNSYAVGYGIDDEFNTSSFILK